MKLSLVRINIVFMIRECGLVSEKRKAEELTKMCSTTSNSNKRKLELLNGPG